MKYNAAHMGVGRSHKISSKFIGKTVAIQGTKRKSNEHVLFERTREHVVFHFPNQGQTHNDAAGVAIMIPKEDMEMVHTIGYSTDKELKGRVGYVRIAKKNKMDITFMTVYAPVEGTDRQLTGKVWDWIEEIINKVKGQSIVIIGTDSNGHTGADKNGEEEDVQVIGTEGSEGSNNWNGERMVKTMKKVGMIAINTHWEGAGGPTYFTQRDGKDKSTRVDYILIPATRTSTVWDVQTMPEVGKATQDSSPMTTIPLEG